jgi:hypothetical protein
MRYERGLLPDEIAIEAFKTIMAFFVAGRVTWDTALAAVALCRDELEDKFAEESLSWDETLTPWHGGHRARSE